VGQATFGRAAGVGVVGDDELPGVADDGVGVVLEGEVADVAVA
jgi:hypothetical protein